MSRASGGALIQDLSRGGRIIGEACHFIDLLRSCRCANHVVQVAALGAQGQGMCADQGEFHSLFRRRIDGTVHYSEWPQVVPKNGWRCLARGAFSNSITFGVSAAMDVRVSAR